MKTKLIALLLFMSSPLAFAADPSPTPPPDKLKVALADMVNKSVQAAGDAKDFLLAQLPDVIQQLLLWKFYEHLIPMVFFFVAFLFTMWRIAALIKKGDFTPVAMPHSRYSSDPKNGYPLMVWGVIKCFLGLITLIATIVTLNLTWLQIWVAPKVYLIEYARNLIK